MSDYGGWVMRIYDPIAGRAFEAVVPKGARDPLEHFRELYPIPDFWHEMTLRSVGPDYKPLERIPKW